jgi:ABC-type antimicrobial peptide transport system permease subunit
VGIVADTVHDSIRAPKRPIIYRPLAQRDGPLFIPLYIAVRPASGTPAQRSNGVVAALRSVDPTLRISARTASESADTVLAQERLLARLSLFGGGFALLLAMVGLYGVTAYSVACRRAEIGIRLALGSSPAGVVRLVTSHVLTLVGIGVLLGSGMSAWSSRLLTSLLYGVEPGDPLVLVAAAATFLLAGILAAWPPAHRASLVNPSRVLRGT